MPKWTKTEEDKAKEMLLSGATCAEVAVLLGRTKRSLQNKNIRDWFLNLKTDYNEKLSRSVRHSSHKISAAQKGRWSGKNNPNYGGKIDNPLSIWKAKNPGYQDGERNPMFGREFTEGEIKKRTSKMVELAHKRKGKSYDEVFGIERSKEIRKAMSKGAVKRISKQKKSGTKPELMMKKILHSLKIKYEFQYPIGYYCVDFYIPSKNLVIQVDGCYWHGCPKHFKNLDLRQKNRKRLDKSCDSYLRNEGYKLIRVWECDELFRQDNRSYIQILERMV